MTSFFSYLLEASLVSIVLYTGYFFVLRDKAAPSFNRMYLLLSLLAAFAIPWVHIPLQGTVTTAAPLLLQPASQAWNYLPELVVYANKAEGSEPASTFSWLQFGGILYFAGFLLSLAFSTIRVLSLLRWLRRLPFRYAGDYSYQLAPTEGRFPTFSFLNYIFWDNTVSLTREESQQMLRHEVAHVKQGHSYDILLLELLTALLWFNPCLYFYRKSIRQVHEHLADQYALQEGEPQAYLQLMVKQTLRRANLPLVSTFFQHNTLNRIRMIQTKPSKPLLRALFGLSLAATVFFVVACEDETEALTNQPQQTASAAEHMAVDSNFEISKTPNTEKEPKADLGISEKGKLIVIKTPQSVYVIQKFKDTETFEKAVKIVSELELESQKLESQLVDKLGAISGEPLTFKYQSAEAATEDFPETVEIPAEPGIPSEPATPTNDGLDIDQVFEVVEEQPRPVGGIEAFYAFLGKELRYPVEAREKGLEGRVFVQFVVNEQGEVSQVKTVKGMGNGFDQEAERIINLTKWEPGTQKGQPVKVRMIMPITFKLR